MIMKQEQRRRHNFHNLCVPTITAETDREWNNTVVRSENLAHAALYDWI